MVFPSVIFGDTINVDINSSGSATETANGGFCDSADTIWNGIDGPEFSASNLASADGQTTEVGVRLRTFGDGTAITSAGGGDFFSDGVEANAVYVNLTGLKPFKKYEIVLYQMPDSEGIAIVPAPVTVPGIPNFRPCFLDTWESFSEHRNWRYDLSPIGFLDETSTNPTGLPGLEDRDFVVASGGESDGFGELFFIISRTSIDEPARLAGFQLCGNLKPFSRPYQPDLSLNVGNSEGANIFEDSARLQWAKQSVRKRSDRKTRKFLLENKGTASDRIQLKARDGSIRRTSRTVYRVDGKNRTGALRRGNLTLAMDSEAQARINLRITPKSQTLNKIRVENSLKLTAISENDRSRRDQIRFDSAAGRYPTRHLERFCKPLDDLRDKIRDLF